MAIDPRGTFAYVTNMSDDTVSVIKISDYSVVDTIAVGDGPSGIAVTTNGKYLYVVNSNDNTVSVIRIAEPEGVFCPIKTRNGKTAVIYIE